MKRMLADCMILCGCCILPIIASLASFTLKSKSSFQVIIWVVNRYGLIKLKSGIFIVLRMVLTMIMLMVATMGPMEFSAKKESKKPNAATVIIASAAKQKTPAYLQNTSDSLTITT